MVCFLGFLMFSMVFSRYFFSWGFVEFYDGVSAVV